MRRYAAAALLAFAVGAVAAQQDPGDAYPGQHDHAEPPKGWYCFPDAKEPSHRCACKNMARDKDDPVCLKDTEEDQACAVWCHKDHCGCQMACES